MKSREQIHAEFDARFSVLPEDDGGWIYPPSPTAIKSFLDAQRIADLEAVLAMIAEHDPAADSITYSPSYWGNKLRLSLRAEIEALKKKV